jgi:hypothetical protein
MKEEEEKENKVYARVRERKKRDTCRVQNRLFLERTNEQCLIVGKNVAGIMNIRAVKERGKKNKKKVKKTRMEEPENALSNSIREIQIEKRKWGEKDQERFC